MTANIIRILALALLLLGKVCAQDAIDTRPGCDSCRFVISDLGQPFSLRGNWLFTREDRPENKDIARDTRDWKLLATPGPWRHAYGDGKNYRVGWYRATLEFAPQLMHQDVVLLFDSHIAHTRVYLDGVLVFERPQDANIGRNFHLQSIPLRFSVTRPRHVVAIRIDTPLMQGMFQLPFELRRYSTDAPDLAWHQWRGSELQQNSAVIGLAFGLFLLLLYSKTRYGMYLHAALASLLCSLYLLATDDFVLRQITPDTAFILSYFGLNFVYFLYRFAQYFHEPTPRLNRLLGTLLFLSSLALAGMLVYPDLDWLQTLRTLHFLLADVVGILSLYATAQGMRRRQHGAAILFAGFLFFLACGFNDMLLGLGFIGSHFMIPLGLLAMLATVLYLTGDTMARTFSNNKQLLHTLQTSHDMMARIQQQAGMGLWRWNLADDEVLWSQTVYDIVQHTPATRTRLPPGFIGATTSRATLEYIHPEDRQGLVEHMQTLMREKQNGENGQAGQPHTLQYRIVRGDGAVRNLRTECLLETDAQGRIVSMYGFLQDITERLAAENALRASQEKISAIYNAIPDMISVVRLHDGVVVEINDEVVHNFAQTRTEIIGRTFKNSSGDFWNDPADYQHFLDVLTAKGKVDAFECTVRSHSGRRFYASLSARLFEIDNVVHVLSICRDISELHRRQSELQRSHDMMAKMQHNAGTGIWVWDVVKDELLLSRNSIELLQCKVDSSGAMPPGFAGRIQGTQSMDFIHPDDWSAYLGSISKVMESRQPGSMRCRMLRGDGSVCVMHTELDTEADAQGEVRFLYGFSRDITEEQRVQDELEQHRNHLEALVGQRTEELRAAIAVAETAQHAAEAANRMKSEFLAMISHEIRTPLGGVIGMLKLGLKDTQLVEETRGKFNLGLSNAQSLLQIINDILDYSKLEAGKMKMECIDFDLPATLQDSHSILEERADAKGLALTMELPADLPRWWQGDPVRLRQVLINLMGNAIKFTEHGSVKLSLQRGADGWLEFAVTDTGVGIPEEALPRLFQKFEQADVSTTRKFGGTGLGLAICKHIVEAMGGTIGVTSAPGIGTTFRFSLPLHTGTQPAIVETIASSRHTHRLSILCAEDGKTNQLIVRELVEGMGHRIDLVENGLEALRALSTQRYDMVLMDMRMPEMDGMEATQLIRAGGNERYIMLDPSLPIIALTANVMEEDRQRYLQAGMDGFLGKPIDEAALFAEIAKVITRLLAQGATLPQLAAVEDTPAQTPDVAALDALFGVDSTTLPVAAVQAVLSTRPSVSQRTWNAMIEVFRSEAPQRMARLKTALDASDATSAALELHTLKGSAAYLQGQEVRALCATLEALANQNDLPSVARRYDELEQTLRAMLDALQAH